MRHELIKTIFGEDNSTELKTLIDNQKLSLHYKNQRQRNLLQLSCLYGSSECLKTLLNYPMNPYIELSLATMTIFSGEKTTKSQKCLTVLLSHTGTLLTQDRQYPRIISYFLKEKALEQFKTSLAFDPHFDKHCAWILKKTIEHFNFRYQSLFATQEEKDACVPFIKAVFFEAHKRGMFFTQKDIAPIQSDDNAKVIKDIMVEYASLLEEQMLDLTFQVVESSQARKNQKNNLKKKI